MDAIIITKVVVKSLWGKYDLEWNLNKDVNILAGYNGSGKTTIIDCIVSLISTGGLPPRLYKKIKGIAIHFSNGQYFEFVRHYINESIQSIQKKAKTDELYSSVLLNIKEERKALKGIKSVEVDMGITYTDNLPMGLDRLREILRFDIISTFDTVPLNGASTPDHRVITDLDKNIDSLQRKYLNYQLDISKRLTRLIETNADNSHLALITEPKTKFFDLIDDLFQATNKKVDRAMNEISFKIEEETISPFDLSSGEKQMLIILLTVLIQDQQARVLFMDEPEISLHIIWQRKLIANLIAMNPNQQIILATHSPGIIMEGWFDKVAEISSLIVNQKDN